MEGETSDKRALTEEIREKSLTKALNGGKIIETRAYTGIMLCNKQTIFGI